MKITLIILTILLVLPVASAIEFDMKSDFSQGETFMAKVSGNFIRPILQENIFFYRGHVRVSIEPYITKIEDDFYIYAKLPENEEDYSIVIENAEYMEGSNLIDEDIVREFSITNETADFAIDPGFVVTKGDFFVEVQNLQNYKINVSIKTEVTAEVEEEKGFFESLFGGEDDEEIETSEGTSLTLKSGEIRKINFNLGEILEPTLNMIELSTENLKYEVPVYIFMETVDISKQKKEFKFNPSQLEVSITTNSNTTRTVILNNTGRETLENVSLLISEELEPYLSLSTDFIDELEENESVEIDLNITSTEEPVIVSGEVRGRTTENIYAYLTLSLDFTKDFISSAEEQKQIAATKPCEELEGTVCGENEECREEPVDSLDATCCLATCEKVEKSSSGKIIGWTIIVAIVIFLAWFFKFRYRGTKREIGLFNK